MVAVEDLLEEMQCRMVGVPWEWVHILHRVANAIVTYLATNPKPGH